MDVTIRMLAVTSLYYTFLWDTATGHPLRTHCHIHRYKSIAPSTMSQVKQLQNLHEMKENKLKCHHGLRLKKFPNCDLQGNERLILTQHRVSLTVKVLENMTMTGLVRQNLETFSILQTELSKCEMIKSPEVEMCLQHLNKYTERVSAECLQEDALLNLVWILVEDLGFLIHRKSREKEPWGKDPQFNLKRPVPKKHRERRKHKKNRLKSNSRS
ncbi:interferon lambda-1 [Mixophyes fleayi]|uniref:interferon lambda-1 n=1 Tax=Mixophyes fleayi TaxID=3061075 RepID=UPI003F4DC871